MLEIILWILGLISIFWGKSTITTIIGIGLLVAGGYFFWKNSATRAYLKNNRPKR